MFGNRWGLGYWAWTLWIVCAWPDGSTNAYSPPLNQDFGGVALGSENDQDSTLIAGLRSRRLFDLAELHCQEILASPDLTPTKEASVTIEVIKTQTARAILSEGTEQDSAWSEAEQTATEFLNQNPRHPRAFLVRAQLALSHLSHGQLLRQELAAEMANESEREQALTELRKTRSLMNELQRDIVKSIPEHRSRTLSQDELTAEELLTLNRNIRYQLAITNVNRAQLYASDDRLNRIEALNRVLEALAGVQRETAQGQPLWWESRILQVECLRLLGKYAEASSRLSQLRDSVTPDEIPQSLLEQQLRLSLEVGKTDAVLEALRLSENIPGRKPQLELSRLLAVMDLANRANGEKKRQWLAQAAKITREMEKLHGGYWGRRAELLLINSSAANSAVSNSRNGQPNNSNPSSNGTGATSTELDLLIRLADQAMRKQRWEDAVKAYDRAAATAQEIGDPSRMFTLEVRASQALEKQRLHEQAAIRLINSANRQPGLAPASAAHLRGCWNWAQVIGDDTKKQEQFIEWLDQHLAQWPNADSAGQAKIWLGGEHQKASQWEAALNNYIDVPPTSPQFGDAISRANYCANRLVQKSDPEKRQLVARQVTERLKAIWTSTPESSAARFQLLLALVDFGIRQGSIQTSELIEPLENLVASSPRPEQQKLGRTWLMVCLATDPVNAARTEELLAQIRQDKELLEIAETGVTSIARNRPDGASSELHRLRLDLIENALAVELSENQRTIWLFRKSDVLADLDQNSKALAILIDLESERPRDAGIKLRIARLTTLEFAATEPQKALSRWRRLATQLKPHTSSWYEAKYNVASLLERSGQKDDARKLLEYIKVTPPGWEKSELRESFDRLLQKCQS